MRGVDPHGAFPVVSSLMGQTDDSSISPSRLDEVLAEYLQRIDNGELIDHAAFIAAHPNLADELRKFVSLIQAVDRVVADGDQVTSDFTDRRLSATIEMTPAEAEASAAQSKAEYHCTTSSQERFRKIRSHAVGGLGEVYLAHDEQLNRVVALKELQRQHSGDPAKQARVLLEGEVTGSLEHPGIVPVYAMGQREAGEPFYVMRFIRGESLRKAIREFHRTAERRAAFSRGSLEFRNLLHRFIAVCNAVAYAHDRGVLHRDLKPENVMLGKFGETLTVDWGMARVIGTPEREEHTEISLIGKYSPRLSTVTQEGSALGTPAYMSPEVAAGKLDSVGPACDVFSLGATLYCLLTNRPPLHAESLPELLLKAERCDFPSSRELNRNVPRALDAICCRAMALEPANRYKSALDLAGDVERWLADERVLAYREPWPERLVRWARRHRSWAMAGVAATVCVTVISVIAAGLINRARREAIALADQNAALAEREKAARKAAVEKFAESRRTVDTWLTGFTSAVSYYPGVADFSTRMLQQAAESYRQFAAETSEDADLELERGRTLVRLSDLQRDLLRPAEASESLDHAEKLLSALPSRGIEQATIYLEVATVNLRQGLLAADAGDSATAAQKYGLARQRLEACANVADSQRRVLCLIDVLTADGSRFVQEGKLLDAEKSFTQAIELAAGLVRANPTDLKLIGPLANARVRLGQLQLDRGAAREAASQFEEVSVDWGRVLDLTPDDPEPLQARAAAQVNLGTTQRSLGHYSAEAEAYRAAIRDYNVLRQAIPDAVLYRENIALTQTDLGQLLCETGQAKEAAAVLGQARELLQPLAEAHRDVVRFREEFAVCLDNLGQAQADLDDYVAARDSYTRAISTLTALVTEWPMVTPYRERLAICESHLGELHLHTQQVEAGTKLFRSAIDSLERLLAEQPELASARSALAAAQENLGDALSAQPNGSKTALPEYDVAFATWKQVLERAPMAEYFHRTAWFLTRRSKAMNVESEIAVGFARRAAEASPENGYYLVTLGTTLAVAGKPGEAIGELERARKLKDYDQGREGLIRAQCQQQLGQNKEASASLKTAEEWIREHRPGNLGLQRLLAETRRLVGGTGTPAVAPLMPPN